MPTFTAYSHRVNAIKNLISDLEKKYSVKVNINTDAGIGSNGEYLVEIKDSEVPAQVTFMSFGIDVSNLDIILTPNTILPPIRVSSLCSLLSSVLEKPLDSDEVLRAIEIYKMNGKLDEFVSRIKSSSTVLGSVTGSFVSELSIKLDKEARSLVVKALADINEFCNTLCSHIGTCNGPTCSSYYTAMRNVRKLHTGLSDAKYYELSAYGYSDSSGVTGIKAANVVEMTDLVMDGEDIVFSSDVKKSLTKLGFDKLITARELTSISNSVQEHAKIQNVRYYSKPVYRDKVKSMIDLGFRNSDILSDRDLNKIFTLLKKVAAVFGKVE